MAKTKVPKRTKGLSAYERMSILRIKFANNILSGDKPGLAWRKAGFTGKYQSEIMNHPEVKEIMHRFVNKLSEDLICEQKEVLLILSEQIRGKLAKYMQFSEGVDDGEGNIVGKGEFVGFDLEAIKNDKVLYLLESIEFGKYGPKYKFASNHGAIDRLAKILKWYDEQQQVNLFVAEGYAKALDEWRKEK